MKNILDEIKNYNVKVVDIINSSNSELNNKIQKIYVINLNEDVVKRNYIYTLMKKYKINYTLVIVERISLNVYKKLGDNTGLTIGEVGCCLSHLWCLYSIIKNKYQHAIIFEDDIILHKNFIQQFLKIYNEKYNFMLLGSHDYNFSKSNYVNVKNNIYTPHKNSVIYGAHANYYSLKGAIAMFNIRISDINFFDSEYSIMFDHFKDTSCVCYPNLVIADITSSKLNHEHEILSNHESNYYSKCFKSINFNDYNLIYLNLLNKDVPISLKQNYETYITKCIYNCYYNYDIVAKIKNRLVFNFFTLQDIVQIINSGDIVKEHLKKEQIIKKQTTNEQNINEQITKEI